MPVIIDTNCIASLFSQRDLRHKDFEPVLRWILSGKGMMIFGGTKYKQELAKLHKYLKIVRLIKEAGKVYEGDSFLIDQYQKIVEEENDDEDFDDPHLVAIVYVTKCRIICSTDDRSIKHVTNSKYYPHKFKRPVYYKSDKNTNLLCDEYVDNSLKPLCKMNKKTSAIIQKIIK
jgi:predicted nucleic acid-binding protein